MTTKNNLWKHQQAAFDFASCKPASMLAMEMGTGKSLVAIELLMHWDVRTVLVLCPKAVMAVWRREFAKWAPKEFDVLVLDGRQTVAQKALTMAAWMDFMVGDSTKALAVVVNYEAVQNKAFQKAVLAFRWGAIILDESHRAKGPKTITSKFCGRLHYAADKRLCLTGTPMPHSPLDVYGQCRFLHPHPELFGGQKNADWWRFRATYAIIAPLPGVSSGVVKGYRNLEHLEQRLSTIAFRVSADVLDLPEVNDHTLEVELEPRNRKIYDTIQTDFIAHVEAGVITASNAMVHLLRLQQLTSGFTTTEDGATVSVGNAKWDALESFLEDLPPEEEVVVFCKFRRELNQIREAALKTGRTYHELSGSRKDLTEHGTMLEEPGQVLGVQIDAGGLGVDLTRARYGVYWSTGFSLGAYLQSRARLHRPGQDRPVHYYHLVATQTVDEKVMKALETKQDIVQSILDGIQGMTA